MNGPTPAGNTMSGLAVDRLVDVWVYLSASPLLWLTVTLLVYQLAFVAYRRTGMHPFSNPVALSIIVLGSLLWLTGTPYARYFEGAQFVHFLLGPATVALAVPLFQQLARVRRLWLPMTGALVVGTLAATFTAIGVGWAMGASRSTIASLAPKSVTAPVAMAISEQIGGLPTLTAVLVVCTGILGAATARQVLDLLKIDDPTVRGFALGTAAHGIGTARAFMVSEETGAFAGLAMGLCALFSAAALPFLAGLVLRWL